MNEGGIQFDEEQSLAPRPKQASANGIALWLIQRGVARDERQASYMLLGIAIFAIIVAVILFSTSGIKKAKPQFYPGQSVLAPAQGTP